MLGEREALSSRVGGSALYPAIVHLQPLACYRASEPVAKIYHEHTILLGGS